MTYIKTLSFLRKINIVPRWFIFLLDIGCSFFAIFFALLLRNNLIVQNLDWKSVGHSIMLVALVNTMVFTSLQTFRGIVRFTGLQDAIRVFISVFVSSLVLFLIQFFYVDALTGYMSSNVVLVLYALFNFTFLLGYRVIVKYGFELIRSYRKSKKTVVIYGAGETGIATKRVLMHDARTGFYVAAFIDDDRKKSSKSLDGVSIISFDQFKEMVNIVSIDEVVISSFALSPQRKNELVDFCLDHDINVLTVPPYNQWADGGFIPTQLKQIKIEDLLERDQIVLDNDQIRKQIRGKRILVTGAAGSIGSEIVRQLASFSPEMIILCDQAETPLHDLELEMRESAHNVQYIPFLTSVNHRPRMEALFEKFKPHHVYHAAAYKHVPMMEFNPMESVKVNVLGTLGGGGGGGVFSGDNILLFLKSEGLVRETLLTSYDELGKTTLADRYAEVAKLKEGWEKNPKVGKVDFKAFIGKNMPRKADSLMQSIVSGIINAELSVSKPDKKASFIEVKVSSKDELFAKLLAERLVKVATDRYIESKTKTKALNIAKLQYKADSLAALLNNKTYAAAASQQSLVDANPALRTAPIASEISSREKTMAATIFAEVVKNLEISKTILNQETPVIQMVDQSTFPLPKERVGKLKSLILGGLLAGFFIILYLLAQKWVRTQL